MIRFYLKCDWQEFDKGEFSEVLQYAVDKFFAEKVEAEVSIDLSIIDDLEMTEMNRKYKSKDSSTDVLAFYDGEVDQDEGFFHLGDVAISIDTAKREAVLLGVDFKDELLLYAVHGTLHLLGLRDSDASEKKQMRTAEKEVLNKFGINPVWN
ncbi:MAG: rRNA maturation RNase YbeY [Planctomycetota bacterium]|jgi:probable rRNA maturation factor